MFADSFENRNNIEIFFLTLDAGATGKNGPSIDKDSGTIESGQSNNTAWHIFVTATNGDHAVHPFTTDDGFDGISNHLTRNE